MLQFLTIDQYANKFAIPTQEVLDLVHEGHLDSVLDPSGILLVEDEPPPEATEDDEDEDESEEDCH